MLATTVFSGVPIGGLNLEAQKKLVAENKLMYFFDLLYKLQATSNTTLRYEQTQLKTMGFWMLNFLELQAIKNTQV